MKKIFCLLSFFPLFLIGQNKIAQVSKIQVSGAFKSIEKNSERMTKWYFDESEYTISENNRTISAQLDKRDLYLRVFDQSLNLVNEEKVKDFNVDYNMQRILDFDEKHYLVYSKYDKKTEIEKLFFREINTSSGKLEEEITVYSGKSFRKHYSIYDSDYHWQPKYSGINFQISADKSKLMLQLHNGTRTEKIKKAKNKSFRKYTYMAFDADLSLLWENKIEYQEDFKKKMIGSCFKNDGTFKILKYDSDLSKLFITTITENSEQEENLELELELGFTFSGSVLKEKANGNLFVTGLYSLSLAEVNFNGTYYYEIDEDDEVVIEKVSPYNEELYYTNEKKEYVKEDKLAPKRKGLRNLAFRDIVMNEDGSYYMISEVQYSEWNSTTERNMNLFGNLIITRIDEDGKAEWTKKIPKLQQTRFSFGRDASFKFFVSEDVVYLSFIDDSRNIELEADKEPQKHYDNVLGIIRIVKIGDDGSVTNYPVMKMKSSDHGNFSYFQAKKVLKEKDNEKFYINLNDNSNSTYLVKVIL